jgi:hypothetical protein
MGTRINLLLDHDLADFRNPAEVLARLSPTIRAAEAVRDYWLASDPDGPHDSQSVWEADPQSPREPSLRRFTGPGYLFLSVTASAAHVRTGGRWRGFLAIEPLRRVHLLAFRAIARALGASLLALYADSDEVDDLIWGGRPPWECVERMEQIWGPPQGSVEDVNRSIVAAAEMYLPSSVWFLEEGKGGA